MPHSAHTRNLSTLHSTTSGSDDTRYVGPATNETQRQRRRRSRLCLLRSLYTRVLLTHDSRFDTARPPRRFTLQLRVRIGLRSLLMHARRLARHSLTHSLTATIQLRSRGYAIKVGSVTKEKSNRSQPIRVRSLDGRDQCSYEKPEP